MLYCSQPSIFDCIQTKLFLVSYEIPSIYHIPSVPRHYAPLLHLSVHNVHIFSNVFCFFLLVQIFPILQAQLKCNFFSEIFDPQVAVKHFLHCGPSVLFLLYLLPSVLYYSYLYTWLISPPGWKEPLANPFIPLVLVLVFWHAKCLWSDRWNELCVILKPLPMALAQI